MVSNELPLHMFSAKRRKLRYKDMANRVEEGGLEQSFEPMDRMSELPDHVIHQILSKLRNPKDIVRTSVLSKKWKALWHSFSVLIFDERMFTAGIGHEDGIDKKKMFREYVSSSINTHLTKKLPIQKLVVHMTSFELEDVQLVDYWVTVAVVKKVKELDLHVGIKNGRSYTLPEIVFISETLTGLRLSGCSLQTSCCRLFPALQKLYLRKLHLVEHFIQYLISGCHSIEDLRLIQCSGLKRLHVSNLIRLNRVEIHNCIKLREVEVIAPNLHTFWFCGKKSTPCKVSLEGCKSLKRLTLEHPQVTREFCENRIASFSLLEKLDLCISDKMKCISISNPYLQRIALKGCKKLFLVEVLAPNLLSFEVMGEEMPHIEFSPSYLTEARLSFDAKSESRYISLGDAMWYKMKYFISKFDPKGFKLVIHSNKNIIIYEDLSIIRFPPLSALGFEIIKTSACIEDILYNVLRTLHPVSLSVVSPVDSGFPKLVYEMIKIKDEDPICCSHSTPKNKCWRHSLKAVEFEDIKDMTIEAMADFEDKNTSTWYEWLKFMLSREKLPCEMTTNLRLYWNSHQPDVET